MNDSINENTNPEVTAEEIENTVTEETAQPVEETSSDTEKLNEAADEISESENNETEAPDEAIETAVEESAESAAAEFAEEGAVETTKEQEKPAKKKPFIQIPVIIALCIVAAALIGYFVFIGFFLKEPEGVTWSSEQEGATYYYEFKNDGSFKANVGSIEINSTYQKEKTEEGNTITVGINFGNFYANAPATYTISGSRILGSQTLDASYGEGYDFSLKQDSKKIYMPDVPEDFTADEKIIGSWLFKYMGYDIYKATFDNKGYMTLEFVQDGIKYNGVYTVDNSSINFTYCFTENIAVPIEYSVTDEDTMTFMGYTFVREGSAAAEATPDQQIINSVVEE